MAGLDERDVVAPDSVFNRLAIGCLVGAGVVVLLAQPRSPTLATVVALGLQAAVFAVAARLPRASTVRAIALLAGAALLAQSSYFFGTASAFSAVVAVVLAVVGMLSTQVTSAQIGWVVLVVMCGSQFGVVLLVVTGVLEDRSLSRTLTAYHTAAQVIMAHLFLQAVFVVAYVGGRAAQNRYLRIVGDTVMASRRAVTREALIAEAQADAARARALRKTADGTTLDAPTDDRTTLDKPSLSNEPLTTRPRLAPASVVREAIDSVSVSGANSPPKFPESRVIDDFSADNWLAAYRSKLKGQDAFALALCLAGVVFVAVSVPERLPRNFGLVGITGIAVCIALRAWLLQRRPHEVVAWPWDIISVLSVGPAYAIGPHSGFATIIATGLFMGSLFLPGRARFHHLSLYGVCGGHLAVFALVAGGVLPDASNVRLFPADQAPYEPYLQHAIVQIIFIASHFAARRIDRRFVTVYERARIAFQAATRADARLQVARAELDAAQGFGEGLFTGTEVGPYKVGRLLGRGGMGEVYLAQHGAGGPTGGTATSAVALKLMRADRLGDPAAQQRFEHEAKLLLQLAGAYAARVIDVGRDAELPYLAMEHVEGPPLSRILRDRELDGVEIVGLVNDVARGLAEIHAAGVVHRDLKPSNLLHGGKRWVIVDFGVSVLAGSEDRSPAGTPQYMAPEQALGEAVDARSDLYSLSLVLYRVVAGRPAFAGNDRRAIAEAARQLGPPDPRDTAAVDEDLALVLRIGLAADPADRFASADELREAFVGALTGRLDERTRARGSELVARKPWVTAS